MAPKRRTTYDVFWVVREDARSANGDIMLLGLSGPRSRAEREKEHAWAEHDCV
jgi:hypothetical protein